MTLTCVSKVAGAEEARAVVAAVRERLRDAVLEADGVRTVTVRVTFADVFRTADFRRTYAVMRVRAVGALAEIETVLGVEGIGALAERMGRLSARDLMAVLAALLRGGGEGVFADELASAAVDPLEAAEAVAKALQAAG